MAYKAFISYSHALDGKLGPAVQSALHRFAKPWYRLRAMRVFRDKTSLSASPGLWPSIETALAESEFFLLFASPASAASKWVRMEIDWWLKHRAAERMLILLTGGELVWDAATGTLDPIRTTALDANLASEFHQEPLFVDLRWAQAETNLSLREVRFRSAILDIAAPLHGVPKDELDGEDVRQHRLTRAISAAAVVTVLVGLVVAIWQAVEARQAQREAETQRGIAQTEQAEAVKQRGIAVQRQKEAETERAEAIRQRDLALGRSLHTEAVRLAPADASRELSLLLAIESLKRVGEPATFGLLSTVFRQTADVTARIRFRDGGDRAAFSPDGRLIAFVSDREHLRIFETQGGRELGRAKLGRLAGGDEVDVGLGRLKLIRFFPENKRVVVAAGNHVWVFGLTGGRPLAEIALPEPGSYGNIVYRFSPSGRLLARAYGLHADVLETLTARRVATLHDPLGSIDQIAISDDGRWAAYGFAPSPFVSPGATVINVTTQDRRKLELPFVFEAVAFSPDGRFVAFDGPKDVGDRNKPTEQGPVVFDTATGVAQPTMSVPSLAWFDADRTYSINRATASVLDRRRPVYGGEFATTTPAGPFSLPVDSVWSADGEYVAAWVGDRVSVHETVQGRQLGSYGYEGRIEIGRYSKMVISATGELAAAYDEDGATVFRAVRGEPLTVLPAFDRPWRILVGRSGLVVADYPGSFDGSKQRTLFWKSGRQVAQFADCSERLASSADSSRFAVECQNDTLRVVDAVGKAVSIPNHDRNPSDVPRFALSPDGRLILSSTGKNHEYSLFDASSGAVVRRVRGLDFFEGALSPDGTYLATYGRSVKPGVALYTLRDAAAPRMLSEAQPESIAFSEDGTLLAAGGDDRLAYVLAVPSGKLLAKFEHKEEEREYLQIRPVQFSRDGTKLATISRSRGSGFQGASTLNVFDIPTQRRLLQAPLPEIARGVYFTPEGDAVEIVFGARRLRIERFSLRAAEWIEEACRRVTRNLEQIEWNRYLPGIPYAASCEALSAAPARAAAPRSPRSPS